MQKILIIRFSSIGDIVLTSPIIRCIKLQTNAELHYLTAHKYLEIVKSNPHIGQVFTIQNDTTEILKQLKAEKYDVIIDLHNNIRSFWVKINLKCLHYSVKKYTLHKLLLLYCGINLLNNHVVDRYFGSLIKMNISNDNLGLDYFIKSGTSVNFNINQFFFTWCIGASHSQKQLSENQIIEVCNNLTHPVVLIGGDNEIDMGIRILEGCKQKNIYNFCGELSLSQSAYLIKKSHLVLTNDTGFMHVAASFKKNIISFWGCTKPVWGFYPYRSGENSIQIVINPSLPPCSKHGNYCKIDSEGCVKKIESSTIYKEIDNITGV